MIVLGFAIDTNIRQVNTVVYNADGRRESRELLDRLKNSDTFHIMRYVQDDNALNDAIISGRARVGVKIPVDYSDRLLHHMRAQVLVPLDRGLRPVDEHQELRDRPLKTPVGVVDGDIDDYAAAACSARIAE